MSIFVSTLMDATVTATFQKHETYHLERQNKPILANRLEIDFKY
jgi:hypothetical protein